MIVLKVIFMIAGFSFGNHCKRDDKQRQQEGLEPVVLGQIIGYGIGIGCFVLLFF